jgi:hypothetical protein
MKDYHLGRTELCKRMNISVEELNALAPPRIREYWDLMEATSGVSTLIDAFEILCQEKNMTPKAALNTLNRHYKRY